MHHHAALGDEDIAVARRVQAVDRAVDQALIVRHHHARGGGDGSHARLTSFSTARPRRRWH